MGISGINQYGNVYDNAYAAGGKRSTEKGISGADRAERIRETSEGASDKNENYLKRLQEKVPYVELETGWGLSMKRDKRSAIMINPKLLEKMQNDPEAEKRYTQTLKDIERAEKTAAAYYNATGGVVERTSHWYVDENGEYCHFAYTRRDDKLNKKLREEAKKNAEELIEKTREKARKKKVELKERLAEQAEEVKKAEAKEEKKQETSADTQEPVMEAIRKAEGQGAGDFEKPGSQEAGSLVDLKL